MRPVVQFVTFLTVVSSVFTIVNVLFLILTSIIGQFASWDSIFFFSDIILNFTMPEQNPEILENIVFDSGPFPFVYSENAFLFSLFLFSITFFVGSRFSFERRVNGFFRGCFFFLIIRTIYFILGVLYSSLGPFYYFISLFYLLCNFFVCIEVLEMLKTKKFNTLEVTKSIFSILLYTQILPLFMRSIIWHIPYGYLINSYLVIESIWFLISVLRTCLPRLGALPVSLKVKLEGFTDVTQIYDGTKIEIKLTTNMIYSEVMTVLRDEYFLRTNRLKKRDIEKVEIEVDKKVKNFSGRGLILDHLGVKNGDTIIITRNKLSDDSLNEFCSIIVSIFFFPFIILFNFIGDMENLMSFDGFFTLCKE